MGNLPPSRLLFHPRGLKSVCLDDEGIKQRAIFYALGCLLCLEITAAVAETLKNGPLK